jgi:DNA-binding NtrC family response regulator
MVSDGARMDERSPGSIKTLTISRSGRAEKLVIRRAALRVLNGPEAGLELELDHTPFAIGKHPSSDLLLTHPSVSMHHAEIVLRGPGYLLRDLGSRNGVTVGGWLVERIYLGPSMVLALGEVMLEVVDLQRDAELVLSQSDRFGQVIGKAPSMRRVFATLETVAGSGSTVLLEGETGTGKGALAEALHQLGSKADGPFVVFDCASTPATLMESELFGHERGAFTGAVAPRAGALENADGGTLFLDEIGELATDLQPKLLRAVETRQVRRVGGGETRTVDIRIIAATNQNLDRLVQHGRFRDDLFYRLAVVRIRVPPLRERLEDLPVLLDHFSKVLGHESSVRDRFPGLLPLLASYEWPGNVRELRNVVERLGLLPLSHALPPTVPPPAEGQPSPLSQARDLMLDRFERSYLTDVLHHTRGNVTKAAALAGVSRRYLTRLIAKYQIDPPRRPREKP